MNIFVNGQYAPLQKIEIESTALTFGRAALLNAHLTVLDRFLTEKPDPLINSTIAWGGGPYYLHPEEFRTSLNYVRANHPDPQFSQAVFDELKTRFWQNPANLKLATNLPFHYSAIVALAQDFEDDSVLHALREAYLEKELQSYQQSLAYTQPPTYAQDVRRKLIEKLKAVGFSRADIKTKVPALPGYNQLAGQYYEKSLAEFQKSLRGHLNSFIRIFTDRDYASIDETHPASNQGTDKTFYFQKNLDDIANLSWRGKTPQQRQAEISKIIQDTFVSIDFIKNLEEKLRDILEQGDIERYKAIKVNAKNYFKTHFERFDTLFRIHGAEVNWPVWEKFENAFTTVEADQDAILQTYWNVKKAEFLKENFTPERVREVYKDILNPDSSSRKKLLNRDRKEKSVILFFKGQEGLVTILQTWLADYETTYFSREHYQDLSRRMLRQHNMSAQTEAQMRGILTAIASRVGITEDETDNLIRAAKLYSRVDSIDTDD